MTSKNKYFIRSRIFEAKFRETIQLFSADLTASQIAFLLLILGRVLIRKGFISPVEEFKKLNNHRLTGGGFKFGQLEIDCHQPPVLIYVFFDHLISNISKIPSCP